MELDTDRIGTPTLSDEEEDCLYPGDVEAAMPEGALSYELANYVKFAVTDLSADLERDSVHANMPIYYERGTRQLVAPDVFFVRGVPFDLRRRSYRLWKARVPHVVFEILSRGHEAKDVDVNRFLFEKLGVEEYYWFDPETATLLALELDPATGRYRERTPNKAGRYESRNLGLEIGIENGLVAIYHEGEYVVHPLALVRRFRSERDQAARERDQAARERDQATRERDQALRERDDERRRREALEARIKELEADQA